jgi:hypothetical protein
VKNAMKVKRLIQRLCVIILIAVCTLTMLSVVSFSNLLIQRDAERQENCATLISAPLPVSITNDLCERGLVPSELVSCNVMTPQIRTQEIESIIRSNIVVGTSSYDEVSNLFGNYETFCEPASTNSTTFRCTYDFDQYAARTYIFYNNTTEVVENIRPMGCNGGS